MTGCGWLVEVSASYLHPEPTAEEFAAMTDEEAASWEPWYPDSFADSKAIVECGDATVPGRGLCAYHAAVMAIPDDEFEAISEAHDGRAFS